MSAFGSPRRTGISAAALVALADAMALACVVLALWAPPAQNAEQRRAATTPVTDGRTVLELDRGTAAALADAGISVKATGPAIGPAGSTVFAFPIVGGR